MVTALSILLALAVVAACSAAADPISNHLPAANQNLFHHPGAKRVIFNIGSYHDPPSPPDDETIVIAIEARPDTSSRIKDEPGLYVLTAAVSSGYGIHVMHHYEDSSSLLKPRDPGADWTNKGKAGKVLLVPTVPLSAIMALVKDLECSFLKIDAQGFDFKIVQGAGALLKACPFINTEVYCGSYNAYQGAENHFERNFLPYMAEMGFVPAGRGFLDATTLNPNWEVCTHVNEEMAMIWRRADVTTPIDDVVRWCPLCCT
ncbi:hypothetical protein FOA52_001252 [Chlamydomonas sp. UWO 241]|nr:hypothetical protein FOA52_001252 [Chlamydomonas sp. UWO 241]